MSAARQVATDWVYRHSGTKGNDRLILLSIAKWTNEKGIATPISDMLASDVGCRRGYMFERIKMLSADGKISVKQSKGRNPSEYRILVPEGYDPDLDLWDNESGAWVMNGKSSSNRPSLLDSSSDPNRPGFLDSSTGPTVQENLPQPSRKTGRNRPSILDANSSNSNNSSISLLETDGSVTEPHGSETERGSGDLFSRTLQKNSSSARKARKPQSPNYAIAEKLLSEWYDSRSPRPQLPSWPGAIKTIARFLDNDYSTASLEAALVETPLISLNAITIALSKTSQSNTSGVVAGFTCGAGLSNAWEPHRYADSDEREYAQSDAA